MMERQQIQRNQRKRKKSGSRPLLARSRPGSGPFWPGLWFRIRTRIRIYESGSLCCL